MNQEHYTSDEKAYLLELARKAIENYLAGSVIAPRFENEKFSEIRSCFVTLTYSDKSLRGCIGSIIGYEELEKNIIHNAINSAINDPRFPSVSSREELDSLRIEISILTPPKAIDSYSEIELGRHGIILKNGHKSAVFLPQVAPEQDWDLETTLTHLSAKAGLFPTDWKEPETQYDVFEAIVFHEEK